MQSASVATVFVYEHAFHNWLTSMHSNLLFVSITGAVLVLLTNAYSVA
jgi:hypothetical protein